MANERVKELSADEVLEILGDRIVGGFQIDTKATRLTPGMAIELAKERFDGACSGGIIQIEGLAFWLSPADKILRRTQPKKASWGVTRLFSLQKAENEVDYFASLHILI